MTINNFTQALDFIIQSEYLQTPQAHLPKLIRKKFPNWPLPLIGLVSEQEELRKKAQKKFQHASQMIFTRKGLEQSTSEILSNFTAKLFSAKDTILEVCAGIGGNSIGLQSQCNAMITIEPEPILNEIQAHNINLYYPKNKTTRIISELKTEHLQLAPAVFIDPDRRASGKRSFSIEDHSPDIRMILDNCKEGQEIIFKLSPMLNASETEPGFKSLYVADEMELKQNLWLSQNINLSNINFSIHFAGGFFDNLNHPANIEIVDKKECLYEINPAIIKAGESFTIAEKYNLEPLLNSNKHFTGHAKSIYPFANTWEILAKETYHPKKITDFLKAQPFERFDFKPIGLEEKETKALISKWGKGQGKAGTVFIFKNKDFKQIILATKIYPT